MRNLMKRLMSTFLLKIFLGIILILQSLLMRGQEIKPIEGNANITSGFGILELLNVGFNYEYNNSQTAIRIGTIPSVDESLFSFSTDFSYFFAGHSEKANKRLWYGKMGFLYYKESGETYSDKFWYINARVGKKFYFSDRAGLEFDGGLMFEIHHVEVRTTPAFINFEFPIFPALGVSFFYKI
jgi:hypothetical protein